MNENISRLMDGELDPGELDNVCAGLRRPDAMATWTCYHVIGETLRGTPTLAASPAQRFAVRLAAEPTVLAPRPRPVSNAATWAFAAAATVAAITVVGWTAMSVLGDPPTAVAKAGEATAISASRVRPSAVSPDFLLAHQEYSPAAAIQGVGPYLRAVGTQVTDDHPAERP
ncbi:MAG: sigma-E factor negative regulatory protein [Casimicrobiaceae bacterium]